MPSSNRLLRALVILGAADAVHQDCPAGSHRVRAGPPAQPWLQFICIDREDHVVQMTGLSPSSAGETVSRATNIRLSEIDHRIKVQNSFDPGPSGSVEWTTHLSSDAEELFTSDISDVFELTLPGALLWTGMTDGMELNTSTNKTSLEPLQLSSLKIPRVYYGQPIPSVDVPGEPSGAPKSWATSVPVITVLEPSAQIGLSLVQSLSNKPLDAYLSIDNGTITWHRLWFRFGRATAPITIRRHLLWHEDCWRPALAALAAFNAGSFEENGSINASRLHGGGSYVDYRGEGDSRPYTSSFGAYAGNLRKMNYQLNWMVTANWAPSHGLWLPFNLSSREPYTSNWSSCIGHPDFQAYFDGKSYEFVQECWQLNYEALERYSLDLKSQGFTPCLYGNYWEYGYNISRTDQSLPDCNDVQYPGPKASKQQMQDWAFCTTNAYMREHLASSPFRRWSKEGVDNESVISGGMQGSIFLDAGDATYEAHLLKMANLMLDRVPAAECLVFDQTGFASLFNPNADDGRSFVAGRAGRSQVMSMFSITEAIGDTLHRAGKAMLWNPGMPRSDLVMHIDGFFAEHGYTPQNMHLNALLGIGGKPVISWNPGCNGPSQKLPGCGEFDYNTSRWLQRLLYFGQQPMLPTDRNDHGITRHDSRINGDQDTFEAYGPLFRQMRLRKWVLQAHPVKVLEGTALANIFQVQGNYVLPVVMAEAFSRIRISVKVPRSVQAKVLQPGSSEKFLQLEPRAGYAEITLAIGRFGCAMLVIELDTSGETVTFV